MDFTSLVETSIADTLASLWPSFAPELILCLSILGLLLVRMFPFHRYLDAGLLTCVGLLAAVFYGNPWVALNDSSTIQPTELFGGMLVYDTFTISLRAILLVFGVLFVLFTKLARTLPSEDGTDFYSLILGALLGMCLMASANHLLMVFVAVEMASVPSYALAGVMRGRKPASEAALKYSIYGAGAAGVMLYGISLLAGLTNSAHIPTIAARLSQQVGTMGPPEQMVLVLAGLMIGVGLAFKLSAVPFHFWCPDIFEGATAEIGAFLSIASKAAALALLVRVTLGVGLMSPPRMAPADVRPQTAQREANDAGEVEAPSASDSAQVNTRHTDTGPQVGLFAVDDQVTSDIGEQTSEPESAPNERLGSVRMFSAILIGLLSILSMTFGNLAAYGQTNIKRLLAYSTIAHAGYMMLPVPAALIVATVSPASAEYAIGSILVYVVVYMFMNLGAFAVIAFLRNTLGSEQIADYAGLIKRSPVVVVCFGLILFSLVGLPPLAGFVGKFALFASVGDAYLKTGQLLLLVLLVAGGLNTVISLFYYLRVVKVMAMEPESDCLSSHSGAIIGNLGLAFVVLMTIPVGLLIVNWNLLSRWSVAAATQLFG